MIFISVWQCQYVNLLVRTWKKILKWSFLFSHSIHLIRGLSFCSEQWDCSHSLWVFFSPIKSSSARSEKLWEQWFLNCSQEKSSQSNGFRSGPTKKFSEHFFTERSDEFSLNFTVWRPILEWIDPGSILTSKISKLSPCTWPILKASILGY